MIKNDMVPCIILTAEQADGNGIICGREILPGIYIAPFLSETVAKGEAKEIGCTFARINHREVFPS